jgi:hypothetical protein
MPADPIDPIRFFYGHAAFRGSATPPPDEERPAVPQEPQAAHRGLGRGAHISSMFGQDLHPRSKPAI